MKKYVSRQESTLGRRRSNIPSLACAFSASATTGGTIYAFGVFANDLKRALHLSQMQLGAISAAFFIAGLLSWIPGMVVDRMKMRFSMALGGISGAFFTTIYWVYCREPPAVFPYFRDNPVTVLSILAVAICLSCGLIVGSVFKLTMLCGGPDGKGPAVGIAKGFVGLGSGVYATIFQAFRTDDESTLDFLPVMAFFFILCATLPALILLPPKEQSHPHLLKIETTPLHFRTMYASLTVLCLFIVVSALNDIWSMDTKEEEGLLVEPPRGREFGKVVLILILWLGPIASLLFLPRKEENDFVFSESTNLLTPDKIDPLQSYSASLFSIQEEDGIEYEPNPAELQALKNSWRAVDEEERIHGVQPTSVANYPSSETSKNIVVDFRLDLSLPEMLQTHSAWIMLWITLVLVGSGTAKTNNMGQMVESLGFNDTVTPATLAIFSVAQAASRIATGILSESALHWKVGSRQRGIPRPFFLAVASGMALIAHLMLAASTSLFGFVLGCAISAIAFGMAWPLMVLIVGDVFGVEHHGANYMFYDGGTKALGTLLLSEYLTGTVYEAHINTDHTVANTCWGPQCFRNTHLAIAGLAVTCILASFLLCHQTRHSYSR